MQPQDPNNQNSSPAAPPPAPAPNPTPPPPLPTPEPAAPTPPQAQAMPAAAPVMAAVPTPTPLPETPPVPPSPAPNTPAAPAAPQPGKKLPGKVIAAAVIGLLLVAAAGVSAYLLFFSGIKLATHDGQKFTIQYPDGYDQKDVDEGSATFVEKGEAATASEIGVYYSAFPEAIDQEQVDLYKNTIKEQLQTDAGEITGQDVQLKDVKVEDVKYKGQDAIQMTAKKVTKEGKEDGTAKFIAVFTVNEFYIIVVQAHSSDPGVAAATDRIINSFTIKK